MSKVQAVVAYTERRVEYLLKARDSGAGKAELARLRRGIGKAPGEIPELWGIFLESLPEELAGKGRNPSPGEWAIYTALTIFALHQQGNSEPMHRKGISLGMAARSLVEGIEGDDEERVLRRLRPIVTAVDMAEASFHLRGMIELFKQKGIALDYGKLAGDLYYFQMPSSRQTVQLNWGRDFYAHGAAGKASGKDAAAPAQGE